MQHKGPRRKILPQAQQGLLGDFESDLCGVDESQIRSPSLDPRPRRPRGCRQCVLRLGRGSPRGSVIWVLRGSEELAPSALTAAGVTSQGAVGGLITFTHMNWDS